MAWEPPLPVPPSEHPTLGQLLAAIREAKARAPSLDEIVAALHEAQSRAAAAYERAARAAGEEHLRATRRLEEIMRSQVDQANAEAEAELKAARREIEARRRAKVDGFSETLRQGREETTAARDAALNEAARVRDELLDHADGSWREVTEAFARMCSRSAAVADTSYRAWIDLCEIGIVQKPE